MLYQNKHHQNLLVVAQLCLMVIVGRLAFDLYLPAIPSIQAEFAVSANQAQLTLTMFTLGFGVLQLLYGPLSDWYGRRIVLLIGMLIFLIGCALSMFAKTFNTLLFAQFLTGSGAGVGVVIARAISRDCYEQARLVEIMSLQTVLIALTMFIAPMIGSFLMKWYSWRLDFAFLVGVAFFCLIIFAFLLPETLSFATEARLTHSKNPLVCLKSYKSVLQKKEFWRHCLLASVSFAGLVVYLQQSPFLLLQHFRLTPVSYSWLFGLIALAFLTGTVHLKKIVLLYKPQKIMRLGAFMMVNSGVALVIFSKLDSLVLLISFIMLYIHGFRLVMPTASAVCLQLFSRDSGAAAALLGACLMLIVTVFSYFGRYLPTNSMRGLGYIFLIFGLICICFNWYKKT